MTRYERQISVPSFGSAAQACLQDASVLVVGAGGLGAPVLSYLAGAGVGTIKVIDGDYVSLTNLHRQTLFSEADIGRPKATIAAQKLQALNSEIRIEPLEIMLTPDVLGEHAKGYAALVDCADSFAVSYLMSDFAKHHNYAFVSASVVGRAGYCGGFCGGAPSMRAVFPDLPLRLTSCLADGVLGPAVGIIGSLQAQMVLDVLTKVSPSPLGQLVQYDSACYRFSQFRFDDALEPDSYFPFIAADSFLPTDKIIDLRSADEAPLITDRAERLSLDKLDAALLSAHQGRLVFCCRSGFRAWQAAERCIPHGGENIALLAAGTFLNHN